MSKKVMVGMSGGVDSSVCAKLLQDKGYECVGVTLRMYNNETIDKANAKTCCSDEDVADARSVAYKLGMQFYAFNFIDDFREKVICKFVNDYKNGLTPNPCIECNRYMKFSKMYDRALALGYDYIATGHYAKNEFNEQTGRWELKKAKDLSKDQSYVLYCLTQEQLAHTLFPLGDYTKPEIRQIAEQSGFVNAKKSDSQDICFVPDGDYAGFIERFGGETSETGNYLDKNGKILGRHKGIIHYTIGQRKGLGIALGKHAFVISKNAEDNTVVLGDNDDLFCKYVTVNDINWVSVSEIKEPIEACVKLRYRHTEQPARLIPNDDGSVTVEFDEPQRAPSAGQSAVFYNGDTVLGGGTIVKGSNEI